MSNEHHTAVSSISSVPAVLRQGARDIDTFLWWDDDEMISMMMKTMRGNTEMQVIQLPFLRRFCCLAPARHEVIDTNVFAMFFSQLAYIYISLNIYKYSMYIYTYIYIYLTFSTFYFRSLHFCTSHLGKLELTVDPKIRAIPRFQTTKNPGHPKQVQRIMWLLPRKKTKKLEAWKPIHWDWEQLGNLSETYAFELFVQFVGVNRYMKKHRIFNFWAMWSHRPRVS